MICSGAQTERRRKKKNRGRGQTNVYNKSDGFAASTLFLSAYPFSRRYSQTVFVSVEATDLADLSDEVDVFLVLRLLTLASLVFSTEVEETAGEDKVAAGIRRPII